MAEKNASPKARSAPETPARQKPKQDDFGRVLVSPFEQWWAYIKTNFVKFYLQLLTINVIEFAVRLGLALLLLAAILLSGFSAASAVALFGSAGGTPMLVGLVAGYLLFLLVMNWLHASIKSLAIVFADSEFTGKPFSMPDSFTAVLGRVLKFVILDGLIRFALAIPLIVVLALIFLNMPNSGKPDVVFILLMLAYLVAFMFVFLMSAAYSFISQFWSYGFLVGGLGVVGALKSSAGLLRKNILQTLIFDIVGGMFYLIAMSPMVAIYFVTYFVMLFGVIGASALMPALIVGVVALWVLVLGISAAVFSSLAECIWLPLHYLFWKGIREKGSE